MGQAPTRYLQLECDQLIYLLNLVCRRSGGIQSGNHNRVWVRRRLPVEFLVFSHSARFGRRLFRRSGGGKRKTRVSQRPSRVWQGYLLLPPCTRQVLPRFRVKAIFDYMAYSERLDSRNKQPSSRTLNERSKSCRRNSGIRSSLDVGLFLSINAVSVNTRTQKTLSLSISNSYTGTTNPRMQLRYSPQSVPLP